MKIKKPLFTSKKVKQLLTQTEQHVQRIAKLVAPPFTQEEQAVATSVAQSIVDQLASADEKDDKRRGILVPTVLYLALLNASRRGLEEDFMQQATPATQEPNPFTKPMGEEGTDL